MDRQTHPCQSLTPRQPCGWSYAPGSFKKIHDLQTLAKDALRVDPTFPAGTLVSFPDRYQVVDMRYGIGELPRWERCFEDYRNILTFVRSCLERMERIGIGNASFLLKKPAWI
jgi:hypothetical protein